MKNKKLIIDFDSTFIQTEGLEVLAEIVLENSENKQEILQEIQRITNLGMSGKMSFGESLRTRLKLFAPTKNHLNLLVNKLKTQISSSIIKNKDFFIDNAANIYIVSGGFIEWIEPIVDEFGIPKANILANKFKFNDQGEVTDIDHDIPLAHAKGKPKVVKGLNLTGEIIAIGDGYTDYEIKKENVAHKFFAFTENIKREEVAQLADLECTSFDELINYLETNKPQNVLILENINDIAVQNLATQGYNIKIINSALLENELINEIAEIDILCVRSKTEITKNVLQNANKLKVIGVFGIGTNNVDIDNAMQMGIAVFNAPYSNTRSVAELVIAEIIFLNRLLIDKIMAMHNGIWQKDAKGCHEIRGKKLGIIGYGNIGAQVSVLAELLGMEVYFYDVEEKLALGNAKKCDDLNQLIEIADVITLHVDGRKTNTNLIGKNEFDRMKDGAFLINASRGFVVDEDALANAIKTGKVAGAAIDVFAVEPKKYGDKFVSKLQGLPNVIMTPHLGAATLEAQINIAQYVSQKIIKYLESGDTTLSVNLPTIRVDQDNFTHRIIHIHKNKPGMLAKVNAIFAERKFNIEAQWLKTNEVVGYLITDVNKSIDLSILGQLEAIDGTILARIIN
jgi:D-3-phosphoglycerate dehydrogenase / 2-oxoglutarate reductase